MLKRLAVLHSSFVHSEPSAPVSVESADITSTSFVVKWEEPERPNGVITRFKVRVVMATVCVADIIQCSYFRFITIWRS